MTKWEDQGRKAGALAERRADRRPEAARAAMGAAGAVGLQALRPGDEIEE